MKLKLSCEYKHTNAKKVGLAKIADIFTQISEIVQEYYSVYIRKKSSSQLKILDIRSYLACKRFVE